VGVDDLQEALEKRDWSVVYGKDYASHTENLWK
jgi:hypothetical protein